MQNDVILKWKHLRGEVNSQWAHVSEDDLDRVDGKRGNLVTLLENHYGWARTRAEREVDLLITGFEARLRRAS